MDVQNGSVLSEQLIKHQTGEFDLELVHKLLLVSMGLFQIEHLEPCINLIILDLTGNKIRNLQGLMTLRNLQKLYLTSNKIESLESIENLVSLERLYLEQNLIQDPSEIMRLYPLLKLSHVSFQKASGNLSNPVCVSIHYKQTVLKALPKLKVLDGRHLLSYEPTQSHTKNESSANQEMTWSDPFANIELDILKFEATLLECKKLNANAQSLASHYQQQLS